MFVNSTTKTAQRKADAATEKEIFRLREYISSLGTSEQVQEASIENRLSALKKIVREVGEQYI